MGERRKGGRKGGRKGERRTGERGRARGERKGQGTCVSGLSDDEQGHSDASALRKRAMAGSVAACAVHGGARPHA